METKVQKLKKCYLCQDITDHSTRNCPNLICKSCGTNGHSKKDCKTLVINQTETNVDKNADNNAKKLRTVRQSRYKVYKLTCDICQEKELEISECQMPKLTGKKLKEIGNGKCLTYKYEGYRESFCAK